MNLNISVSWDEILLCKSLHNPFSVFHYLNSAKQAVYKEWDHGRLMCVGCDGTKQIR